MHTCKQALSGNAVGIEGRKRNCSVHVKTLKTTVSFTLGGENCLEEPCGGSGSMVHLLVDCRYKFWSKILVYIHVY